jgi:phytoene dehydrogenase-like protein
MTTLEDRPGSAIGATADERRFDVVVVGGGHNGLTCAAYLARAGKRVLVLEALPTAGGYCTSEATVPAAPGFLMNTGGIDHIFTNIGPSVIDELQLARFGLRYLDIDPLASYLGADGTTLRCGGTWIGRARRSRGSPGGTPSGTASSRRRSPTR